MSNTPQANRGVVVDPQVPGRLVLRDVAPPSPSVSEALVRVAALSLNRGELRRAATAEAGWRPGWDVAGTVETPATDGSGPPAGARVVGLLPAGAWAEWVAVPSDALAELPASVSLTQAATLPVAGLTALYALEKGGPLLGRRLLVTGASGGVGHLAVQLARQAGATVVGLIRQEAYAAVVQEAGAHAVVAGDEATGARAHGPFDLILESVGGQTFATALDLLAPGGVCVVFGQSGAARATIDLGRFYATGGASVYGFFLFHELRRQAAAGGLARLLALVADGRLRPRIDVEAPWSQIAEVAQHLVDRRFAGKAVLTIAD